MGKLPEKEFRVMIVKMIQNLKNRMEKKQELTNTSNKDQEEIKEKTVTNTFNKDQEEIKEKTETKNTITEIKNTLEGINSRITEAQEWILSWMIQWWKNS